MAGQTQCPHSGGFKAYTGKPRRTKVPNLHLGIIGLLAGTLYLFQTFEASLIIRVSGWLIYALTVVSIILSFQDFRRIRRNYSAEEVDSVFKQHKQFLKKVGQRI